jgi:hypothetical protein
MIPYHSGLPIGGVSCEYEVLDLVAAADPHMECETPWYGPGLTRIPDCLTALALSELTVHGHDVATGAGRPWPISA